MSALEGIADQLAEAVHVADVPEADMEEGNPLTRILVVEVAQRAERIFELMSLLPSGP
jgi:cell division protein FtsX